METKSKEELIKELAEARVMCESLRESEQRFREFVENANDGIWAQDLTGNFTLVNKVSEKILGYSIEEFSRLNIADIVTHDSLQEARKIKQTLMRQEVVPVYELEVIAKDGHLVYLEVNSRLMQNNGEPIGIEAILRDISKRKQVETMHHDLEAKYHALIQNLSDGIIVGEYGGKIIESNKKAASMLGYSQEDLLNMSFVDLHPREEAERVIINLDSFRQQRSIHIQEVLILTKSGKIFPAELTATLVEYEDNKLIQLVIHNLTDHKRNLEIITRQSQEILEISTPVVQIWDNVVSAPIIGTLDSQRAEQFTERLLNKIVESNSSIALVDITGVPAIDTKTAQHLIDTMAAVRLLGGQAILTGVRPAIAQTLVHLGINLSDIVTRPTLEAGLKVALQQLGLQVTKKN